MLMISLGLPVSLQLVVVGGPRFSLEWTLAAWNVAIVYWGVFESVFNCLDVILLDVLEAAVFGRCEEEVYPAGEFI